MLLRFTLDNDTEGSQVIDNPEGWENISVKLERHPKFHSLVEQINVPITFYGQNDRVDGGYGYIKRVLETQGFNALISILIEISEDEGATWETFFEGNLDLSDKKEFSTGPLFYKLQCPIIQDDLWSSFINRIDTPVNLLSETDLNGDDCPVPTTIDLNLLSQRLNQEYNGEITPGRAILISPSGEAAINDLIQLDLGDNVNVSEIKDKFVIPIAVAGTTTEEVANIFTVKYAGSYELTCRIEMSILTESALEINSCNSTTLRNPTSGSAADRDIKVFIQINNGTPIEFTETDYAGDSTAYTYSAVHELNASDTIKIYALCVDLPSPADTVVNLIIWGNSNDITMARGNFSAGGGFGTCNLDSVDQELTGLGDAPSGASIPSYLIVTAATTYPDTTTDALLIHDAAQAIVHRITGIPNDSFYSEILGRQSHGYTFDGCDSAYALMKGIHIRGRSMTDKNFFMSFMDFWDGADPIFNLGCGYEEIPDPAEDYGAPFSFGFDLGFES